MKKGSLADTVLETVQILAEFLCILIIRLFLICRFCIYVVHILLLVEHDIEDVKVKT